MSTPSLCKSLHGSYSEIWFFVNKKWKEGKQETRNTV